MNKFVIGKLAYKYIYYLKVYTFDGSKQGRPNITPRELAQNMDHGILHPYKQNLFKV